MNPLSTYDINTAGVYFSSIPCNLFSSNFLNSISAELKKENLKIRNWISSGKILDDIKEIFGDIKFLKLNGGDILKNLDVFQYILKDIPLKLPNLAGLNFSIFLEDDMSAISLANFIIEYKKQVPKGTLNITFLLPNHPGAQMDSIFNPFINRIDKVLEIIIKENIFMPDINFTLKSFSTSASLNWLSEEFNLIHHHTYFLNIYNDWISKYNLSPNIKYSINGERISFRDIDKFSKKDGINLAKITKIQKQLRNQRKDLLIIANDIFNNIMNSFETIRELYKIHSEKDLLTALYQNELPGVEILYIDYNKNIHLNEYSFIFSPEIISFIEMNHLEDTFNKDYNLSFNTFISNIKEEVIPFNDEYNIINILYKLCEYYSNSYLKIQYISAIFTEKLIDNNISFLNDDAQKLALLYFALSESGRPDLNLLKNGSIWVINNSKIELIFNGAFEEALDYWRIFINES